MSLAITSTHKLILPGKKCSKYLQYLNSGINETAKENKTVIIAGNVKYNLFQFDKNIFVSGF